MSTKCPSEEYCPVDEPPMEAHFKLTDNILDTEQSPQDIVAIPEEPSKAEDEWQTLPQKDATLNHASRRTRLEQKMEVTRGP
jgi:hypothetical protein